MWKGPYTFNCSVLIKGKWSQYRIRAIILINICLRVQSDCIVHGVVFKMFEDFWCEKWCTSCLSWVTWPKCSILTGQSCVILYMYMMQAMCFCWSGCFFTFFLTNNCQLFITDSPHTFKRRVPPQCLYNKTCKLFNFKIHIDSKQHIANSKMAKHARLWSLMTHHLPTIYCKRYCKESLPLKMKKTH